VCSRTRSSARSVHGETPFHRASVPYLESDFRLKSSSKSTSQVCDCPNTKRPEQPSRSICRNGLGAVWLKTTNSAIAGRDSLLPARFCGLPESGPL
jgi:hypothetical protein